MKNELTNRQKEILEFIQQHVDFNGYPPTYREIGKKFNISSTFGVKRHIDALIKKGFLTNESNQSRTLSIIPLSNKHIKQQENFISLPIIGRVAAGQPILAEENIEGNILVDISIIKRKTDCFGLKVRGDSMINAGILEGDLVIVSPQKEAASGDIVIALIGDEATMKRFIKKENKIILHPENESYADIEISNTENFNIIGKVIGVFRTYN
ncbi:transcriptional repressor LexA [Melioribacteraceae bacterium 4301-Me]|uniref:transcriptional repressor LexA n=1 Tax=Pyranulibacter aquaticus TaxID=3163344 RepID=UPI00359507A3